MIDSRQGRRLFVLDTNVLMHDPTSIYRFQEHDIFVPMVVLEELDRGKKGMSEVARNARQTSRFLDQLMGGASKHEIDRGLPLPAPNSGRSGDAVQPGHLFVLGDNHAASLDSRRLGAVDEQLVVGKVVCRLWPFGAIQ